MSWARFDDGYDDHPKVMAVTQINPLAAALHPQAITASARRDSDGLVDVFWLMAKVPSPAKRNAAVRALVDLRLFDLLPAGETRTLTDTKGYQVTVGPFVEPRHLVHDYLDFNDSSACLAEKRRKEAERKARGRQPDSGGTPGGVRADKSRTPSGVQPVSEDPDPTRPDPTDEITAPSGKPDLAASIDEARARLKDKPVQQVFDAWVKATGRTARTVLDAKRRRIVESALKSYGLDDCLKAVANIGQSEWAAGKNDRETAFNDLDHALGDSKRFEKWRDWKPATVKAGSATPDVCPSGGADAAAVERWGRAVVILRERPDLVTWLEGLHPHGFDGNTLVLGAPAGAATWLTDRWRPVFAEAAGCPVEFRACADGAGSVAA